ncbi:MAG: OmpA family protein, partial [Elusimicrobiota bacterium]
SGITAGMGVRILKNIMFDYAYLSFGELGGSHRVSLTYKFWCPGQAVEEQPESMVDPHVIILEKLIVLEDTHFEFDSSTLTKDGARIVIENTQVLKDNPVAKIRIAGYASASGAEEYNQKLSERRANAIKEILVKVGGISQDRIATIGYGETRPAIFEPIPAHIDSMEAQANMRVLFEIIVK